MGCLNAHGTFRCLVDTLKRHWNKTATEQGIRDDIQVTLKGERPWTDAEVIVDDIMLHSEATEPLIKYFEVVLQTLQRYQVTVKLKKCRFFPKSAEFVGMDVEDDGNRPARSKMQALEDLKHQPPNTLTDLRQLIGLIGFYQDWIANYELRIGRWRQHIKDLKGTKATENEIPMETAWTAEDQQLLHDLIDELTSRPTLARPDYTRRFYLKTDWCRLGMAAVLLQADPTDTKAKEHETNETNHTGPCNFDKHRHQLRLRPIAFSSRKCTESEGTMHSYTGEAATGVWAIEKYKRHLFGKEFTWMTDCNGLRQFFEGEDVPTHMHQRMRQRLLRFLFTIVHRPARFMVECDVLTRYNNITSQWRPNTLTERQAQLQIPIAIANEPVKAAKGKTQAHTLLAMKAHPTRSIWTYNAGATNIQTALAEASIDAHVRYIEERIEWRSHPFDKERPDPHLETIDDIEATIEPSEGVDWIVTQDGHDIENETETALQFDNITRLIHLGETHGCTAIIMFTRPTTRTHHHTDETSPIARRLQALQNTGWHAMRADVHANRYGAAVATKFTLIVATKNIHTLRTFHLRRDKATPLHTGIEDEAEQPNPKIAPIPEIQAMQRPPHNGTAEHNEPRIAAMIQRKGQDTNDRDWVTAWTSCFDIEHPGPDLNDTSQQWYESPFAVETTDAHQHTTTVRGIRIYELVNLVGYDEEARYRMLQQPPEMATMQIRTTPPKQLMAAVLTGMQEAEDKTTSQPIANDIPMTPYDDQEEIDAELRHALTTMLAHEFQQTTTIPLPTTAQWQDATAQDWDLHTIMEALRNQTELQRDDVQDATLFKLWKDNKLEEENGIIYHTGDAGTQNRKHLRTRIPPPKLRQAIFSALHASPMAGHTGYQKTFWKIAARYYWPRMAADIKQLTLGCGHCNAANITSHEAQQQLQTFATDEPFDVITLDVWHPGKAATIKKGSGTHVVTCIDAMTGFASATFVDALDSETMTKAAFTAFFIVHGLPRLVIIDSGSEFAGALITLCSSISIPHYTVSKGNHKAIMCERFHRYLNKIQRIHAADCETFQDFMFGTIFAVYAWNSAPVDGTNIARSYAAMGREFPFPIDFEHEPITPRDHEAQAHQTLEHIDSAFPLWRRQQEILKTLVDERRDHHRNLKNQGRNMKTFAPGDLVVIKKQVQTTQERGPAKARMHARGPYRVLEQIRPGTYRVQRLPGIQGAGRRGRVMKESAARLTKIPSTLVIHKPASGIDTRLATYRHAIVDNPLENILGLHEPGRYRQTEPNRPFAYEKIEDLWHEAIDDVPHFNMVDDSEDSENDDTNGADDDDDDDHNKNTNGANNHTNENNNATNDDTQGDSNNTTSDENSNVTNQQNKDNTDVTNDNINDSTPDGPNDTINDTTTNDINSNNDSNASANNSITINNRSNNNNTTDRGTDTQHTSEEPTRRSTRQQQQHKRKHDTSTAPQRTSTRTAKRPTRYLQNDETRPVRKTTTKQANKLYQRITKSRDRMFFIRYTIDTTNTPRWFVVQARLTDDDPEKTRNEGTYTVRFFIREHSNSKTRQQRNCRYWPEIHQLRPNGTLGPIVPIRPGRAETVLKEQPHKYRAYEQHINLCDTALVGPFNFAVPNHYQQEGHRIAFEEWEELKMAAEQHNLDVSDIEEIVPLR